MEQKILEFESNNKEIFRRPPIPIESEEYSFRMPEIKEDAT